MAIKQRGTGDQIAVAQPECTRCGCRDFRTLGNRQFCRHCGKPRVAHIVTKPDPVEEESAVHYVVRCPHCKTDSVKVTRTASPVRYYKCKGCDHNFKKVWV